VLLIGQRLKQRGRLTEGGSVVALGDSFFVDSAMTETGFLTIRVAGYLDMDSASEFTATLGRYLDVKDLVVDLSACDFLDSAGIRALLMSRDEIGPSARMKLVGASPHIRRALRLTGADQVVDIDSECTRDRQPGHFATPLVAEGAVGVAQRPLS
jgi:anti-anti-sigma factor